MVAGSGVRSRKVGTQRNVKRQVSNGDDEEERMFNICAWMLDKIRIRMMVVVGASAWEGFLEP